MQWVEFGPGDGIYTDIVGMDPAAEWLLGPGSQDYLPEGDDQLVSCIISLYEDEAVNYVVELTRSESPIFIPEVFLRDLRPGAYFVALTTKAYFDQLADPEGGFDLLRRAPKEIKLGAPVNVSSLPSWTPGERALPLDKPPLGPPNGEWPSGTVVIGIIDDGIAFAHERFRTSDGKSRVQCFWRQDPPDTSTTVPYGHEICKQGSTGIDALLSSSVDEDQFYRRARLIDFADPGHKGAAWRVAHGTHVLDLAAGADPGDNVLDRPIIGVQLPYATTGDTSGGSNLKARMLHAVAYILDRADALAPGSKLPVVINFSYGLVAGPHDGTSDLERALDDLIVQQAGRLRIVLPAGNFHLSRCHAEVTFTSMAQIATLRWRVQPDDVTPSYLEI